ncbi:MAG: Prodigiosin synthesizing transferase PigC [Chloroflexi bacterium]|nr:Prodigiosin synthesizing transferase PigC [Chloroflexota bacterium]
MKNKSKDDFLLEYRPKYTEFRYLMQQRITKVLLVSSIYDSFIIEEDARLSDQIFEEFHNLNLRTLPQISRASSVDQALRMLKEDEDYDLVITMRHLGAVDPWKFAEEVKNDFDIPVILLLDNTADLQYITTKQGEEEVIDNVFVWNGNPTVFVAMIKLLEDRMNVDQDIEEGDVRVIIIVEDSVRFGSLYLPVLYTEIMRQTHCLIKEGGNDYHSLLKMRSRPKILLATTYEEAMHDYKKYKDHLLGLITDIKFPRDGKINDQAGFDLVHAIRDEAPTLPIMIQSSREANREQAERLQSYFVNKNDRSLINDLQTFMLDYMGFGSFTFRLPNDEIVGVANDLFELRGVVEEIPLRSFVYHARNDHFSGWLAARGEFAMARELKPRKVYQYDDHEELRQLILSSIDEILQDRLGLIVDFERHNYHPDSRFVRLRPGSLGGKGRGLAFLLFLRNSFNAGFRKEFPNINIQIPRTYVIGTDAFEQFMQNNNLYDFVFSGATDEVIKERFIHAHMPESLWHDLHFIFENFETPLAVRSSNIFEDSLYRPFAGVFATYMIPNCYPDVGERVGQLVNAIKLVYASTYFQEASSYAETLGISLAESRMAVVIQEVVGTQHGNRFYPDYSGVASSHNYYPLGERLRSEDPIAYLALGLGKTVVDGELSRRFSPKYPDINLYSHAQERIKESQRNFYAVNRACQKIDLKKAEETFLERFGLREAIQDGTLTKIADTYRPHDGTFSSGYWNSEDGYPIITFDRQLKYNTFPVAKIINRVLSLGEKAMGIPVEIEFAGNFSEDGQQKPTFSLLQIRPFVEYEENLQGGKDYRPEELVAFSTKISGNRAIDDIQDIVYIKPEQFDSTKTPAIALEVDQINKKLRDAKRPYILIGPGRWGTRDPHVGIPVAWSHINAARVIMEADLPTFKVDHSQGSHFFHNLISAGIPYLCVEHGTETDFVDWVWLDSLNAVEETTYLRHVQTDTPFLVIVNGKEHRGQIVKPGRN